MRAQVSARMRARAATACPDADGNLRMECPPPPPTHPPIHVHVTGEGERQGFFLRRVSRRPRPWKSRIPVRDSSKSLAVRAISGPLAFIPETFAVENLRGDGDGDGDGEGEGEGEGERKTPIRDSAGLAVRPLHPLHACISAREISFRLFRRFPDKATAAVTASAEIGRDVSRDDSGQKYACACHVCFNTRLSLRSSRRLGRLGRLGRLESSREASRIV